MAELAHLARPGAEFDCRVTPRARQAELSLRDGRIQIRVTAPPEDGRANRAAQEALALALGVAKSRLTLIRGATSREKLFRLD